MSTGDPTNVPAEMAYLVVHGPGHNGTQFQIPEGITTLGRLPSNDLVLIGDLVSRRHARILFMQGIATFQDLGSQNGCQINGTDCKTAQLRDGDELDVGGFRVAYRLGQTHRPGPRKRSQSGPFGTPEPTSPEAAAVYAAKDTSHFLLCRISQALAKARDLPGCVRPILDLCCSTTSASRATFLKFDPEGHLESCLTSPLKERQSVDTAALQVAQWVVGKRFVLVSDELAKDLRFQFPARIAGVAVVCMPLCLEEGETPSGALYLERDRPFSEREAEVLTALSLLLALGLRRLETSHDALTVDR